MKFDFLKKTIFCFVFLAFGYFTKAQTIVTHEVVSVDTLKLNTTNQVLNENKGIAKADIVTENLDSVKSDIKNEIFEYQTIDPTTSGMILMYVDGKPIYTKVQKTGETTLSIIYIPKQN